MIQLSEAYDKEYKQAIMRKMRCTIKWGIINPTAASGNTATSTNQAPFSNISDHILSNATYPNAQYGTFEDEFWDLTGSMKLIPENEEYGEIGYISESVSDLVGDFETPPIIQIDFTEPVNLYGLLVNFSLYKQEYATDFDIIATLDDLSTHDINITDNEKYSCDINLNLEEVIGLQITINKWSVGGRRARLTEIEFGLYKFYYDKDLIDVNEIKTLNQVSTELPISTLTFTVLDKEDIFNRDNTQGLAQYLTQRQPVEITYEQQTDNGWEEISGGKYYLRDWTDTDSRIQHKLIAENLFSFMENPYYGGKYYASGTTIAEEMERVLESCFPLESGLNGMWDLSQVPNVLLYMPLPIKLNGTYLSHKDCLQMLAQYAGCVVTETSDGKITPKLLSYVNSTQTSTDEQYKINMKRIYDMPPKATLKSVLKRVDCAYKSIAVADTAITVFSTESFIAIAGTQYIFEYSQNSTPVAVDNTTVNISITDISGNPSVGFTSVNNGYATIITFVNTGVCNISVTAKILNIYTLTFSKYNSSDSNYQNGQIITISNELLSTKERAESVTDNYMHELKYREEYTINVKRDMRPDITDVVKMDKALVNSDLPLDPINGRILEIKRNLVSSTEKIKLRKIEVVE